MGVWKPELAFVLHRGLGWGKPYGQRTLLARVPRCPILKYAPLQLARVSSNSVCAKHSGWPVGKMKRLEVRQLWLQSLVKEERIRFQKIPRARNAADTLTKHWCPDAHPFSV